MHVIRVHVTTHPISTLNQPSISPMLKLSLRNLASSTRFLKGKVFPSFSSREELASFLRKPTWRVHDVIPDSTTNSTIDARVVYKILKLSGLSTEISKEQEEKWIAALNTQVALINHIDDNHHFEPGARTFEVFRLLASDHHPPPPLTYEKLLKEVKNVEKEADAAKGEQGFDTSGFRTVVNEKRP